MPRHALALLLAALVAALLLSGCGAKNQETDLTANPWVGKQVMTPEGELTGLLDGTSPVLYFSPEGKVTGNATVNNFTGPYTLEGRNVDIGPLATTKVGGPQVELVQETQILAALDVAVRYTVRNGVLEFYDPSGKVVVSFTVAEEPKLTGPAWKCRAYLSGTGAMTSVVSSAAVSAAFAPDGTLSGSGGVNQYSATYKVDGDKMSIGPDITSTEMAGSDLAMAQEAAYLKALPKTASYKIAQYTLTLYDGSGQALAEYVPGAPK